MRIAYFDCFSGISGNMALGAFLDAGVSCESLQVELLKLKLEGYHLSESPVQKMGIAGKKALVTLHEHEHSHHSEESHHHVHGRHLLEIIAIIQESGIDPVAKRRAISIFEKLAQAEAAVHQTTRDKIHFHEVGAVDAIIDIVGTCIAMSLLNIDEIQCSPLPMGHGFVHCAHGMIPLPAPAVVELTKSVPVYGVDVDGELVTPTGAAIVTTLASRFGPCPAMKERSVGYGAGDSDFPNRPNLLRVFIGETSDSAGFKTDQYTRLETNIDDMNPQFYDYILEKLLADGAKDVYLTSVQMKKGRPGILLTVLCDPGIAYYLSKIIVEETTSLGVRINSGERFCCIRDFETVDTCYGPIRIKKGYWDGKTVNISPEYEDCKKAADVYEIPLKRVYEEAKYQAVKCLDKRAGE